MPADQAWGLAAALGSALVFGLAAVGQAHVVRHRGVPVHTLTGFVARSVREPWTWVVLTGYLVGFLLHAVAIWLLPLYLAQATIALSLPITAAASGHVQERLDQAQWGSVGLVSLGLVMLAAGAGPAGEVVTDSGFVVSLWAAVALLALSASLAGRLGAGGLSGGGLGALAGIGYAGSAIAVRGVTTPVDAAVVLAALAVPALSLVAFWLYSRGMHGTGVSATTAPMIVGQTFIPSVVGVALLGDGVREGWAGSIVLGLAVATWGAVRLARAQATSLTPDAATSSAPGRG